MISQMNVVQNAARLAMDHRAAFPSRGKRQPAPARGRLPLVAMTCIAAGLLLLALAALFA